MGHKQPGECTTDNEEFRSLPGTPLDLCVPSCVRNNALTLLQPLLSCNIARVVFSPALKIYLAESNVITIDGSVSEESVVYTEVDQFIFSSFLVRTLGGST